MTPEQIMLSAFNDELEKISGLRRVGRLASSDNPAALEAFGRAFDKWQRRVVKGTQPGSKGRAERLSSYFSRAGITPRTPGKKQWAAGISKQKSGKPVSEGAATRDRLYYDEAR